LALPERTTGRSKAVRSSTTKDRDLFLPLDAGNELRAWTICEQLGFELWSCDEPLDKPRDRVLAERVVERQVVVSAIAGDVFVDLSLTMTGFSFDDVWNEHRTFRIKDIEVPVVRLTRIIESKRIANRPKDRHHGAESLLVLCRDLPRGGAPEASLSTLLQKAVCHEAYHAGQLGIGRRLVGKAGAIA